MNKYLRSISFLVTVLSCSLPLVTASEEEKDLSLDLAFDDPCARWVSAAETTSRTYEYYREQGFEDIRSLREGSVYHDTFEEGSSGRILLLRGIDDAEAGLGSEEIQRNVLKKCRELDPESVKNENAGLADY